MNQIHGATQIQRNQQQFYLIPFQFQENTCKNHQTYLWATLLNHCMISKHFAQEISIK